MGGNLKGPALQYNIDINDFCVSVLDRFLQPNENDNHWLTAVKLAAEIGYPVLNLAAVSKYDGAPLWVRTTMSEAWADLYLSKQYFRFDPLLSHMQFSNEQIVLDCDVKPSADLDPELLKLMDDVKRFGYGRFRGIPFNWPTQSVFRIAIFGLMTGDSHKETPEMIAKARVLAEIFATRIAAPDAKISNGFIWPGKTVLTDRESELLSYLAVGLKNDRIAERCGLAEVTVRKHLLSARQKLGATTREQALAIALQNGLIKF